MPDKYCKDWECHILPQFMVNLSISDLWDLIFVIFFAQAQFLQRSLVNERTMTQICSKVAFLCIQMLYNNCTSSGINHDSTCLHKRLHTHAAIGLMCAWWTLAQARVHYHAVNTSLVLEQSQLAHNLCDHLAQKSPSVFVWFGWVAGKWWYIGKYVRQPTLTATPGGGNSKSTATEYNNNGS